MFGVFLLFKVRLLVAEAQHSFIDKAICVNDKAKCTSVAEGFSRCTYAIPMCANPMNCLRRDGVCHKSGHGTKTGDPRTVHSVYIADSDICS